MADLTKIINKSAFQNKLLPTFLGFVSCILCAVFFTLSLPVFVFQRMVTFLANSCHSCLGEIFNGQSAIFVADYMASTPPRSNCVVTMTFQGQLTTDEVKARVMSNWIMARHPENGKLIFGNFQRCPIKWLGFLFWKDASSAFVLDNHVYQYSDGGIPVTDDRLTEITEKLLNDGYPRKQSPWEIYVIENYLPDDANRMQNLQTYSVLILKFHHCLVDGVGLMNAIAGGLLEKSWNMPSPSQTPKTSSFQKIYETLTFPLAAFIEMSYFLSHFFRSSHFKIPDQHKEWHQTCARSGPIPIQRIKSIKNKFGVSYTSVLLSAISSAVERTLKDRNTEQTSMLCLSVLSARGIKKRKILTNHMTGVVFDLPTDSFHSPEERLFAIHRLLDSSIKSVIPTLGQWYSNLIGSHFHWITSWFAKNRAISIGLTNFAAMVEDMEWDSKRKWIHTEGTCGAHNGEAGVSVAAYSHGEQVGIQFCAEKSLFTKDQAQHFVRHMKEEIESLHVLSSPTVICCK